VTGVQTCALPISEEQLPVGIHSGKCVFCAYVLVSPNNSSIPERVTIVCYDEETTTASSFNVDNTLTA